MKKIVSAGLSALLLCGMCAPAYAANTAAPAASSGAQAAQTPVQLSFDKLESTVRERNISIKSYDNTVKSAEKTDVSDNYFLQYYFGNFRDFLQNHTDEFLFPKIPYCLYQPP